ncbi:hypothetical protein NW754_001307 [Fusarium falciforme]|nr:hypothetical protein NW754_001449 [Fusarium falciforme]KAJ4169221.1 hypothetical protein NW754_001307 [Fusarium falciforme]
MATGMPSCLRGPKDHNRYMAPGRMAYYAVHVRNVGGAGSFCGDGIGLPDTIPEAYKRVQPAFFQPRQEWDHWDPDTFEYPAMEDSREEIKRKLGNDDQKPAYFDDHLINLTWADHAYQSWVLFKELCKDKVMLPNDGFSCILRMLRKGLEHTLVTARLEIDIEKDEIGVNKYSVPPSPFLPDDYERVWSFHNMGFVNAQHWRSAMMGKRFYAGFARHGYCSHYTAFIWDAKRGHFYHFDSYARDQMERAKIMSLVWREHLAWAGLPFDYKFYAIPMTPQRGAWECGILCFFSLFTTLRGLVGIDSSTLGEMYTPETFEIDGEEIDADEPFDLLIRDWVQDPWETQPDGRIYYTKNTDRIRALFQCMIFDDLGIKDGQYLRDSQLRTPPLAHLLAYQAIEADVAPEIEDLYTDWGGFMPAYWRSTGLMRGWTLNRLFRRPSYHLGERGEFPTGYGPELIPDLRRSIQKLPGSLIRWYAERGLTVIDGIPIESRTDVVVPDDPVASQKGKGKKEKTPAPNDQMQEPETPSTKLANLGLDTPKRPRPESESGSSYKPGSSPKSSSDKEMGGLDGGDNTEPIDQPVDPAGLLGKSRDGRNFIVELGPHIGGAETFKCSEYETDEEGASTRRQVGMGTKTMSVIPGESGRLAMVEDRVTQRLLTGNYATYVPGGLVRPSQWDDILQAAAAPWTPAVTAKLSREERMRKRQKSREN